MIARVTEHFDGRGSAVNREFETSYDRVFTVHCDTIAEDIENVKEAVDPRTALAVPHIGDVHPEVPNDGGTAYCIDVKAKQRSDSPELWTVTAEYSTVLVASNPNPLLRPARVRWDEAQYQKAAQKATFYPEGGGEKTDHPVTNSAGDPFDPPLLDDEPRGVLVVRKNLRLFPRAQLKTHRNRLNFDTWYDFPKGTVKLQSITSDDFTVEGEVGYWPVTYVFHVLYAEGVNPNEGWVDSVLDQGMHELDANGKKTPILARPHGAQFSAMAPLDGQGHALSEAEIIAGNFKYRRFLRYKFAAFADLHLDDPPNRLPR
jgi:hypothetical protein